MSIFNRCFCDFSLIIIIYLFLIIPKDMYNFSHSILGKAFIVLFISYYAYNDIVYGLLFCLLVIFYYDNDKNFFLKLTNPTETNPTENMDNMGTPSGKTPEAKKPEEEPKTDDYYYKEYGKDAKNDKIWYLAKSDIHGDGVFAKKHITTDTFIDVAFKNADDIKYFGSKVNHSNNPNTYLKFNEKEKVYDLYANDFIPMGDEITANYNDTPNFIKKPDSNWK